MRGLRVFRGLLIGLIGLLIDLIVFLQGFEFFGSITHLSGRLQSGGHRILGHGFWSLSFKEEIERTLQAELV